MYIHMHRVGNTFNFSSLNTCDIMNYNNVIFVLILLNLYTSHNVKKQLSDCILSPVHMYGFKIVHA